MAHCPYEQISDLESVFDEIRTWEGVKEKSPGVFYIKSTPFLHFHVKGEARWADVWEGKTWGDPVDIRPKANKSERSAFMAEVRRRYETTALPAKKAKPSAARPQTMSLEQPQAVFEQVSKALKSAAWFKKGKWRTSTHPFPSRSPEGITFHVSKTTWFNDDHLGVHVESYLSFAEKDRTKSYLTIHLLHHDLIPGTNIRRKLLAQQVIDNETVDLISSWGGYAFRAGKLGMRPFKLDLDGTRPDFAKRLTFEASRLCQALGPKVDRALAAVCSAKKTSAKTLEPSPDLGKSNDVAARLAHIYLRGAVKGLLFGNDNFQSIKFS